MFLDVSCEDCEEVEDDGEVRILFVGSVWSFIVGLLLVDGDVVALVERGQ